MKLSKKIKRNLITLTAVVIAVRGYVGSGKFLDKKFNQTYDINSIFGKDRYETSVLANELGWEKADEAVLMNTNSISTAITAVSYANEKNIPIFFTTQEEISPEVWSRIKELGVKKVYVVGGIRSISKSVERAIQRTGANTVRVTESKKSDISLRFAEALYKVKKYDTVALAVGEEFGYAEGVSMAIAASRENIPVITLNESSLYDTVDFLKEKGIKKTYIIGDNNKLSSTVEKLVPNPERISGTDSYDLNRKIIKKFYDLDNTDEAFIVKGGTYLYGERLQIGEFVNSLSVANVSADKNIPIIFCNENFLEDDQEKFINEYGIKKLTSVGFVLERAKLLNPDRVRNAFGVALVITSFVLLFRALRKKDQLV